MGRCRGCTAELCGSTEKLGEGLWLPGTRLFMRDMSSAEEPNSSGKHGEALHGRVKKPSQCLAVLVSLFAAPEAGMV